jgi:hypothetical protein
MNVSSFGRGRSSLIISSQRWSPRASSRSLSYTARRSASVSFGNSSIISAALTRRTIPERRGLSVLPVFTLRSSRVDSRALFGYLYRTLLRFARLLLFCLTSSFCGQSLVNSPEFSSAVPGFALEAFFEFATLATGYDFLEDERQSDQFHAPHRSPRKAVAG